jgi:carbonic anhydrase
MVPRFIEVIIFFERGFKRKEIAITLIESQHLMFLWICCSDLCVDAKKMIHCHDARELFTHGNLGICNVADRNNHFNIF